MSSTKRGSKGERWSFNASRLELCIAKLYSICLISVSTWKAECKQTARADKKQPSSYSYLSRPNWGPKGREKSFCRPALLPLSKGLDDRPPPYLKVLILHWYQTYLYPENNEIKYCLISYATDKSQLRVFGLILSISLPPQQSRCPNRPPLLNSSNSRLWSRQTFHVLILCNWPCLLLSTIKLLILLLLFVCTEVREIKRK